jgi:hypothetical protein
MTPREWRYASVLVTAVALAIALPWLSPDPVDWSDSFARDDTRPYGSRVLFESLPALFPDADTVRAVPTTPYLWLRDTTSHTADTHTRSRPPRSRSAYLFVTTALQLDPPETRAVLAHVARGNVAFLAAHRYGGPLADSLSLATALQFSVDSVEEAVADSSTTRLHLSAANLERPTGYPVRQDAARYAFTAVDTTHTTVLGTNADGDPTLVRTTWGNGHLILSTTPRAFTNYHTLRSEGQPYVWAALSTLPADLQAIWWDARPKPGTARNQTAMRFVLSNPALRMAYWLLLGGALLFVVTRGRRRQRPVPVVEPPTNRTVDFVRHVGQLYYERGDPLDLARKKIEHFRAFVRRRLDLPGGPITDEWIGRVTRRSGVPHADVAAVAEMIDRIEDQSSLSNDELKTIDDRLDAFYEQAVS